jgi:subfamily B ATP-binding cassette protein MsbA
MQDTILLSGNIKDNMRFAKQNATDEEIVDALKNAEAWKFVEEFSQGLGTVLGERGVRLSGGQKQRLSIARVFLKNPPIVVFDEATSALDTITEKQIQATMERLFKERTSIIIAHRLSTIINCDKIVLMDKGKVIASGTHKELVKNSSLYYKMCEKQSVGKGLLV